MKTVFYVWMCNEKNPREYCTGMFVMILVRDNETLLAYILPHIYQVCVLWKTLHKPKIQQIHDKISSQLKEDEQTTYMCQVKTVLHLSYVLTLNKHCFAFRCRVIIR